MIPLFKVRMSPDAPAAIANTIASGTITEGPRVVEFEDKLGAYLGMPVLTVNSGTSALHLAATLLDLKPGDEVISTPITCAATNLALVHAGASIVWADVDPRTGLIDPVDVARKAALRTRAVMAVDWAGALCDFQGLSDAARVPVIEDAAHSFGAIRTGSPPDSICWSFQAIKHLTTADGGGLFVRDDAARERARRLRWFGIDRRSPGPNIDKAIADVGFKYHMNDLTASIGLANIAHVPSSLAAHRENAAWYDDNLKDARGITLPVADPNSAWWLYTIILEANDAQREFVTFMASKGVECSRAHSRNDAHPAFKAFATTSPMPGVDYFDSHQVSIPVGWWVGDKERARVAEAVRDWGKR